MAQVDYFLKIEGLDGESEDKTYKKNIEILSFNWGATNSGSMGYGTGGGTGKVVVQDMHFTSRISAASPKLAEFCHTGKHFPKAVLVCRKAGGDSPLEYLKITLSDIMVSSYQLGGAQGDVLPSDQFSLNFAKIEKQYTPQSEKGTGTGNVKFGWNVKQNAVIG